MNRPICDWEANCDRVLLAAGIEADSDSVINCFKPHMTDNFLKQNNNKDNYDSNLFLQLTTCMYIHARKQSYILILY